MKVSDVVQHADLSVWAEAALILFLAAFLVTAIKALRSDPKHADAMASTPLNDDPAETGDEGSSR
jgi:hypothetical protein